MDFIKKLQEQPESTRKIILWLIIVIIGLGLTVWWINSSYQKIKDFQKEEVIKELNLPGFEGLPKIEVPESFKQELDKLEQEMKKEATKEAEIGD